MGVPALKVKITDVARHAKVGAGTVSRVLNGAKSVSPRTRARVLASIDDLGYVPNLVARGLAANRTGIIAALVPALGYTQHAEVIQAITDYLYEHGITLMIGHSGYDLAAEEKIVAAFLARRPDAFYVTGTSHSAATRRLLKASGAPVVEGGNLTADPIDCVVGYSNFEAMRQLTRLLNARGHEHIVHVTSSNEPNDRIRDRLRGYEAACTELRITKRMRVLGCHNTLTGGADAVAQVLASGRPCDALQCSTDLLAVGAILECQRRNLNVPKQIAISGFDDLPIAASIVPALTTVRIDRTAMGRRAGEVLLHRLAGNKPRAKIVDVGFEIVERGSTRSGRRSGNAVLV